MHYYEKNNDVEWKTEISGSFILFFAFLVLVLDIWKILLWNRGTVIYFWHYFWRLFKPFLTFKLNFQIWIFFSSIFKDLITKFFHILLRFFLLNRWSNLLNTTDFLLPQGSIKQCKLFDKCFLKNHILWGIMGNVGNEIIEDWINRHFHEYFNVPLTVFEFGESEERRFDIFNKKTLFVNNHNEALPIVLFWVVYFFYVCENLKSIHKSGKNFMVHAHLLNLEVCGSKIFLNILFFILSAVFDILLDPKSMGFSVYFRDKSIVRISNNTF